MKNKTIYEILNLTESQIIEFDLDMKKIEKKPTLPIVSNLTVELAVTLISGPYPRHIVIHASWPDDVFSIDGFREYSPAEYEIYKSELFG